MFWYKLGAGLRCIGGILLCTLIYSFAWGIGNSPFPFEKEKEYYLYSPSSQAQITSSIDAYDLFFLKGESAKITTGESVDEVLSRYGAEIIFTEKFDEAGGISYYCYSPKLKQPILLDGKFVNLHVVVTANGIVLGTPIVFGGY
jgi:hypothetical protein